MTGLGGVNPAQLSSTGAPTMPIILDYVFNKVTHMNRHGVPAKLRHGAATPDAFWAELKASAIEQLKRARRRQEPVNLFTLQHAIIPYLSNEDRRKYGV